MASEKEIDRHLAIALREVGKINPWYDKETKAWVFAHDAYPVEYGGNSPEEVIKNYPLYLREFILHRLAKKLDPFMEKKTKGKGGKRIGSGRPRGMRNSPRTKQIRVPIEIADWLKYPGTIPHIQELLKAYSHISYSSSK